MHLRFFNFKFSGFPRATGRKLTVDKKVGGKTNQQLKRLSSETGYQAGDME